MLPTEQKRQVPSGSSTRYLLRDTVRVLDDAGTPYVGRVYAEAGQYGTWVGLLEFQSETPGGAVVSTGSETTQPSVGAVAYWASGLGPQYLRGALERALYRGGLTPSPAPVLVRVHEIDIVGKDGTFYRPRTYARGEPFGTWIAWLEFHPRDGEARVLRTGNETSQPTLDAVAYWATGLEPVYFEGAFARAVAGG